jgi:hypothetical protein
MTTPLSIYLHGLSEGKKTAFRAWVSSLNQQGDVDIRLVTDSSQADVAVVEATVFDAEKEALLASGFRGLIAAIGVERDLPPTVLGLKQPLNLPHLREFYTKACTMLASIVQPLATKPVASRPAPVSAPLKPLAALTAHNEHGLSNINGAPKPPPVVAVTKNNVGAIRSWADSVPSAPTVKKQSALSKLFSK